MDMKRILQAMDGVSTKPVEGASDMSKFLSIVNKNDVSIIKEEVNNNATLNEGANPHKVSLPVQMAMQHYQKPKEKKPTGLVGRYFKEAEEAIQQRSDDKKQLMRQYASVIAERVMMKESALKDKEDLKAKRKALQDIQLDPHTHKDPELKAELIRRKAALEKEAKEKRLDERSVSQAQARTMAAAAHNPEFAKKVKIKQSVAKEFNKADTGKKLSTLPKRVKKGKAVNEHEIPDHSMGFTGGVGPGMQMAEMPISATDNPNDPMIHGHEKANPMTLQGRIHQTRAQLQNLAHMAQSNDLVVWQKICELAKGGMFMGLEQNLEQVRHGISELAAKRKKGGAQSRGIDKNIEEAVLPKITAKTPKAIKPKAKTSSCRAGQVQTGVQTKDGKVVPKCSVKKLGN